MSPQAKHTVVAAAQPVETPEGGASPADTGDSAAKPRTELGEPVRAPVKLFNSWCKGCGICVAFCPTKALGLSPITGKCIDVFPEACTKCGLCELRCPDFAITVIPDEHGQAGGNSA